MKPKDFRDERKHLTDQALEHANLEIKRFFGLDTAAYREGALDAKTKEMLGLVASMVLRCDDCICYHIDQCVAAGITKDELLEVMNIALIVGGSIVIPHFRRALDYYLQSLDD